ncbi:uncharacterized protein RHOBADRAFT_34170 [Rhodotorula graminis WP1]|uniref:Epoxide hydrolase n=1 Tax=Rhodotorula graminis (strain WP1) TaxID=578459 RepID=A0A194SBF1_RHOGW|nr:uncharacterized protein RHOBADRAFT_34170 [Rhodotorula graminis WP1]KPV76736.1 hypothetical protein RHOBADRAFT_34170 [Rhodotorula graminis WP1]
MVIRAVIFDIGGVVVGSPVAAITDAEKRWGLPSHWINAAITAMGDDGPFQRFERSEISQDDFYRDFGARLSDVDGGNKAYRVYCKRARIECPPLPTQVRIDGKELWGMMMAPALEPDELVVNAINRLRASRRYKVAALTNNFAPLGTAEEGEETTGAGNDAMRGMFDEYIESAVEGLRKPDPAFFRLALDRVGVAPSEAVFLDDIGHNLAAARALGMHTIRVQHGKSHEAIAELERLLEMDLTSPVVAGAKL